MNDMSHLYHKNITLEQAILGGNFKVQIEKGKIIKVNLKPGSFNGQVIRLKNIEDSETGQTNDTFIELKVLDHPLYIIDGLNLMASLIITPAEAEMGSSKKIPGPNGKPMIAKVPPKSKDGQQIIITGAGLTDKKSTGNIIYTINIDYLEEIDEPAFIKNSDTQDEYLN